MTNELRTYRINFTPDRRPQVRSALSPEGAVLNYLADFKAHCGIEERRKVLSVDLKVGDGWRRVLDVALTDTGAVTVAR